MKTLNVRTKLILMGALAVLASACNKVEFRPVTENIPQGIVTPEPPAPSKSITKSEIVAYGNKQVDFLLVLDDSNSMSPELAKLAARMTTFVNSLEASNIDWQMCLTTTRGYVSSGGVLVHGPNLLWKNYVPKSGTPAYLLKKGSSNLNNIFTSTISGLTIGGSNSGDERGIKAAHDHFKNSASHSCYREGAAISVILISDEDERSVGGDPKYVKTSDAPTAYQPFELEDLPDTLLTRAKATFGEDLRFTFSSIIVKPDDLTCEAAQDTDTSPSHFGRTYEAASKLTDGGVGSICDADYSANLNTFKDKIVNSLSSLTLECDADPSSLTVKVEGILVPGLKLDGKILKFDYPLIEGTKIDLSYNCLN